MTCIVGLLDSGKVWMGGDSAGVAGLDLMVRADQKVFKNEPFIMGFTTSFRMGQLLRYSFVPPAKWEEIMDAYPFMVNDFINAVRKCLKDGGYAKKEHEVESGGDFLGGFKGRLFGINSDYQVGESCLGFLAIGCGSQIALESLFSTIGKPPEERVLISLKAAQAFSTGVREPFVIDHL